MSDNAFLDKFRETIRERYEIVILLYAFLYILFNLPKTPFWRFLME